MHNARGTADTPSDTPKKHPAGEQRESSLQWYKRAGGWIRTHRWQSLLIAGVLLVAMTIAGAFAAYALTKPVVEPIPDVVVAPREEKFYSPLTGAQVKNEAATKQLVTAIMIENSPDARPHSGLKQAGVVYEAIAEGGITRYVALYQEAKPSLIGPVRSLRPYFIDWAAPFQPAFAHVGGSAKALAEIRGGSYRDIDQFFHDSAYWRASDRAAPHNVYTSFAKLDALNQSKGYKTSSFTAWQRVDGAPAKTPAATKIAINFSSAAYNTSYRYNSKTNTYARSLGGKPHKDREKGQVAPSVVIAMRVNESTVWEETSREAITTTGSGKATIFQNGGVIQATWRKTSKKAQIEWLDSKGKPIELVRGQTWIAAVPNGRGSVSWSK